MKTNRQIVNTVIHSVVLLFCLSGAMVQAGQVTYPDDAFVSGSTLNASDLNSKFNELKSAVNDNDAKIGSGILSIPAYSFTDQMITTASFGNCLLSKVTSNGYAYYLPVATATANTCDAVAGVNLPDGVTVTQLDCTVYDNSTSNNLAGYLRRIDMINGGIVTILSTPFSTDNTVVQTLTGTSTGIVIDNATYSYYLIMFYGASNFTTLSIDGRFYGCQITYQYN